MLEKHMTDTVGEWCLEQSLNPLRELWLSGTTGPVDVVAVRFAERIGKPIPAVERVIAIELKLDDVSGVIGQCRHSRAAHAVFAAMPRERIDRMRSATVQRFRDEGIGLLAVDIAHGITVVVYAEEHADPIGQHIRRKLWRRYREAH